MRVFQCFRSCLVLVLCLVAFATPDRGQAAEPRFWQLTFGYDAQGLVLERAAQIQPMAKAIRTPGLEDAVLKIEYELEWLDVQGRVVLTTPVTVPLRGRTVMGEGPLPEPHRLHVMPAGAFVVRVPGPDDPAEVTQVRLMQPVAAARAPAGGLIAPAAFQAADQTFQLPPVAAKVMPVPGPISATKVRNSGADGNRFVMVIEGDGFTAANLAAGAFSSKVTTFLSAFFGVSPWSSYQNVVNVYRLDIESAESGADYEDAAPASGGTLRDTYLNAAFWVGGTERCMYLTGNGESRAFAAADQFVGVGVWDEVLVFGNSTKYGGCGGSVGVSSLNASADEIQIHEFGHSFGALADEYEYGSTSTSCSPSSARNVDCSLNFPNVKWNVWVTPGAPMPTPATATYTTTVGAFEGAAYQATGMFRPKQDCRMRTLGVSFCPVCKEGHILKLFEKFQMIDSATPAFGVADVPVFGARSFSVTPVNVSSFAYRWFLGGALLPGATNASVVISNSQVTISNLQLRVETTHLTTNVRAQSIVQSNYTWALRLADEPGLRVSDLSVVEGNSASRITRFFVTLSFPHILPVTVDFQTTNGTALAGSDYTPVAGTLTFAPGVTTNQIDVLVLGDTLPEAPEVFFLNLSNPTNALLVDRQGAGLILDNDNPPTITLTNPPPDGVFFAPATISLGADAYDSDGSVGLVEFYAGAAKIGSITNGPTTMVWSNVPAGSYVLRAVARDNFLKLGTSAPVSITVISAGTPRTSFVSVTNAWRYDQTTNDYGTAWKETFYNDSSWAGPSAALFYNETAALPAPKNTSLLLTNNSARLRTYYFRTQFTAANALDASYQLIASNLVDDGAVFYLNGTEAGRLRMTGSPTRTTLANAQPPSGDATAYEPLSFPPGLIVAGNNVLAVEVHQQADTSSDVVFGMSLEAVQGFAPILLDTNQPADRVVRQGQPLALSINATSAPAPAYQWFRNGLPIGGATNAAYSLASMVSGAAGSYFVRVTNQLGQVDSRTAVILYADDPVPPNLVYALGSNSPTRVLVVFSKPVTPATATVVGNYAITSVGNGSALAITAAAMLNSTSLVLTTAARLAGSNYLITVNNVRDLYNNVIPANSQAVIASELIVLAADNQSWRYFQNGTDPGAGWNLALFDDLGENWFAGPALFDAKSPPGRTTLNGISVRTMLNLAPPAGGTQTLTYYFRALFHVPGGADGARLRLRTLVDDGAVYYLNGQEVLRLRMPAAPVNIGYTNVATVSQGDAQNIFEGPFELPADALRSGTNVFAVEVHQASATSTDVSFAAQLAVELPMFGFPAPALGYVWNSSATNLVWTAPGAVLQESPTVSGPWEDVSPVATNPYPLSPSNVSRFFRLRLP